MAISTSIEKLDYGLAAAAASVQQPHIEIDGVAKTYRTRSGPVEALGSVRLTIQRGEFVSIIGPSGCGKSTLLKILLGVATPTSGTIRMDGRIVSGPQRGIGMVFQNSALLPWRSVLDNVLLPVEVLGLGRSLFLDKAKTLLERAGLAGFERKSPHELSGGMQQRVSICRALIHDPELLLMDEPFGALDALTREAMQQVLLRISRDGRLTVLFVTHSIDEAVLMSDRVVVMSARPSVIMEEIAIDLPRERDADLRSLQIFQQYAQHLRHLLGGLPP
ncbi:MAG: ABC transporter ATP-binding protein [Thermomicrobiales bacterium]